MWATLLALSLAASPGTPPATPSCACVVSPLEGPCGYEHERCDCSDGHGWSTYWLFDAASGMCEEYRVVLPLEDDGD